MSKFSILIFAFVCTWALVSATTSPTMSPTVSPTTDDSGAGSASPTQEPTRLPRPRPTSSPTSAPTTSAPTTSAPTSAPSVTGAVNAVNITISATYSKIDNIVFNNNSPNIPNATSNSFKTSLDNVIFALVQMAAAQTRVTLERSDVSFVYSAGSIVVTVFFIGDGYGAVNSVQADAISRILMDRYGENTPYAAMSNGTGSLWVDGVTYPVLGVQSFTARPADTANMTNGPNGEGCKNGVIVDDILYNHQFICLCYGGFSGDNCQSVDASLTASSGNLAIVLGISIGLLVLLIVVIYVVKKCENDNNAVAPSTEPARTLSPTSKDHRQRDDQQTRPAPELEEDGGQGSWTVTPLKTTRHNESPSVKLNHKTQSKDSLV